ncbi:MAG: LysR family transcriptional regulator [Lachnospiraceae bacterium]|nr:LysR family transcriptional regulator [Lachnospiraceae bacterium]
MTVSYEYYRIFYYVARYGSFTKAAEALYANQPNITRTIANLEEALGCKLFVRTHHGVTLTPEGQLLFSHVSIAHEQLQLAEQELADTTSLRTGTVTIGTSETALHLFLLERLRTFRDLHPGIRIRIRNLVTPQAVSALRRGEIDFSVVTTPIPPNAEVSVTTLMTFQELLVCGTEYAELANSKHRLHLRDLTDYPLIMLSHDTMTYEFYNEWFLRHGVRLETDTEAATADHVLPMVEHNLGLGFVPRPWAEASLKAGSILEVPLAESVPERSVILVCNNSRAPGVAASEFLRFLNAEQP